MEINCYKCGRSTSGQKIWYGLHSECFKEWFQIPSLESFQNIASRQQSDGPFSKKGANSSFFHGKFRKYSSTLGESIYILKVQEKEYPELPATEYLCNQIYASLGIHIPPFFLISFEDQQSCFVTKNFMEDFPSSSLVHIYHFFEDDSDYDCENLLKIIEKKTGRIGAKEDFVYLTLADSLMGNNDRHGRNLGLIQTPKGCVLAPFYDNPSYLGTEIHSLLAADHQPTGAIRTHSSSHPRMKDYVNEWQRLGFGHVVDCFRKKFSLEQIQALIAKSFLTQKRRESLLRLITKRSRELCG